MSGAASRTSRSVSKTASVFANGSPGPAMPTTESVGTASRTFSMYSTAGRGAITRLVTPGRLSLTQSSMRLQNMHWMLQRGATGRWMRPWVALAPASKQGCKAVRFLVSSIGSSCVGWARVGQCRVSSLPNCAQSVPLSQCLLPAPGGAKVPRQLIPRRNKCPENYRSGTFLRFHSEASNERTAGADGLEQPSHG